jgi:hypothetical protein
MPPIVGRCLALNGGNWLVSHRYFFALRGNVTHGHGPWRGVKSPICLTYQGVTLYHPHLLASSIREFAICRGDSFSVDLPLSHFTLSIRWMCV